MGGGGGREEQAEYGVKKQEVNVEKIMEEKRRTNSARDVDDRAIAMTAIKERGGQCAGVARDAHK